MSNEYPTDPLLRSIEARLVAARPGLSNREVQETLLQCLAAGQRDSARKVRRWQWATVALGGLLVASSFLLVHKRRAAAGREPAAGNSIATAPEAAGDALTSRPRRGSAAPLDAWQARTDPAAEFALALHKFRSRDESVRSLAVGAIARPAPWRP